MTPTQKHQLKLSKLASEINDLLMADEPSADDLERRIELRAYYDSLHKGLKGAEAEFNAAQGIDADVLPWAAIAPIETRADSTTAAPLPGTTSARASLSSAVLDAPRNAGLRCLCACCASRASIRLTTISVLTAIRQTPISNADATSITRSRILRYARRAQSYLACQRCNCSRSTPWCKSRTRRAKRFKFC